MEALFRTEDPVTSRTRVQDQLTGEEMEKNLKYQ